MILCAIPNCTRPRSRQRRLCCMHRSRKERHGDPLMALPSGRKPKLSGEALAQIRAWRGTRYHWEVPVKQVCRVLGVSPGTVRDALSGRGAYARVG